MNIGVKYDPKKGLRQVRGISGLFLGGHPVEYSYATESVILVTSDLSVTKESFVIANATDGSINVTLPTVSSGRIVTIKKIDASSNLVTILPNSSETIDGGDSVIISTQWTSITVQVIEGNWYIK